MDALVPLPPSGRRYTASRRVTLGDVTPRGRVRLDAVARYLQDVANDDAHDSGIANPGGWVVRKATIEVDRFPTFREDLDLVTFCSGTGGWWAERRTDLIGRDRGVVRAAALWVQIDPATGRPLKLGPDFHQRYGDTAAGRTVAARLTHPGPPPGLDRRPFPLRVTDLDLLDHVNNAVYWAAVELVLAAAGASAPLRGVGVQLEHRRPLDVDSDAAVVTHEDRMWVLDGDEVAASARLYPISR